MLDSAQRGTKASHSHVIVSDFLVTAICLISLLVCGRYLEFLYLIFQNGCLTLNLQNVQFSLFIYRF